MSLVAKKKPLKYRYNTNKRIDKYKNGKTTERRQETKNNFERTGL